MNCSTKLIATDRELLGLRPDEAGRYEVGIKNARGLSIRVYPEGDKVFELRYVAANGARRRMKLGTYPALKLADAKKQAGKLRNEVVDGNDPSAERAASKRTQRTGDTVEQLARAAFKAAKLGLHGGRKKPKSPSTITNETRLYERHIAPKLGNKIFTELRRRDIKEFMRDVAADSGLAPSSVGRVGEVLSGIFAFAVHEDRIESNPVAGLSHPLSWVSRERRFSDTALKALWDMLVLHSKPILPGEFLPEDPQSRLDPLTCLSARLMIVTLCRRGEAVAVRWDEIDRASKKWTVPRERTKSRRTEIKPLSDEAIAILDTAAAVARLLFNNQNCEFVFPLTEDPSNHIDGHRVARAMTRLCKRLGIPHGSPHDFRRTGATTLTDEKYGFTRFIVSKVLGHRIRDGAAVTEIYDLNEYLPQKRAAMDAWAKHVRELRSPAEAAANPIAA
ncbi:MAG: tyrosine-type recombinase/integrase [Alphaproteobacteria bacterium]|nr:tyrosine-type recombinase/integrase [Alphaproteobacteria bacterium]